MTHVTMEFASFFELWDFRQLVTSHIIKTAILKHTLCCHCTEAEIELAIYAYGAKVTAIA